MKWGIYLPPLVALLFLAVLLRRARAGQAGDPVFAPAEFWNDFGDSAAPDAFEQYDMSDTSTPDTEQANLRAFLEVIKYAEGGAGYDTLFGYGTFHSYERHPNVRVPFRDTFSTAAGPYQINWPTYRDFAERLGLSDFTPETQDRIAVEIIRSEGALDDVYAGRFADAIAKLGGRWASFPSSPADQPVRPLATLLAVFVKAGGTLAG